MSQYVIYIPGLSDHKWRFQYSIVRAWRVYGVKTYIHHMDWRGTQPFKVKFENLLNIIDNLTSEGHAVSLVGVSAGASTALNAFAARQTTITSVVCLCGKIQNAQTVSPHTFRNNPAFKESLELLKSSLPKLRPADRARVLTVHPLRDSTVPVPDTKLEGTCEKAIPTIGHALSILYGITLGSFSIVRFIKETKKSR